MNQAEILDQFVLEARECLETIGKRLLDVERQPDDKELLNDLFRQVHTLKGNCGLFEFKSLEHLVHAGEDVLDRVRHGSLAYNDQIADALLEAMDYTTQLIDEIETHGGLPAELDARSKALAQQLRSHLSEPSAAAPAVPQAVAVAAPRWPDWVSKLPAELRSRAGVAVRYRPEPECFFKGEDPWNLAHSTPGLIHLAVEPVAPWPAADAFDCYRCNLEMVLISDAPRAYVEEHFRYVPEQIEVLELEAAAVAVAAAPPAEAAAPAAVSALDRVTRPTIVRIWLDQRAVLARPGVSAGTVLSVRTSFAHLLTCWADAASTAAALQALQALPPGATPLAAWAQQYAPTAEAAVARGGVTNVSPPEQRLGAGVPTSAPAFAATPAPASESEGGAERTQRVLKVSQDKIDRLMSLIGEMVVAKNALPYLAVRAEEVFQQRELSREIKAQYSVINRIAEDMQHAIMQVRMLPVGTIFQRFARLVRDISKKLGKDVQLVIEGEETEADKNVIESLADPLIHIVRNSLDHGIETPDKRRAAGKPAHGTIRITARQESDRVILEIKDDGAGVNTDRVRAKAVERGLIPQDRAATLSEADAVQLVFLPGFSTADTISDLSGRGVGMDVVRSAVERVNGLVELSSVSGQGTTIRLSLPLSMAVTNVMMIEVAGRCFGVPMDLIVETVRVHAEDIHSFKQAQTTVLRGRIVPLRALHDLLALDAQPQANEEGELAVLVARLGNENVGLVVDNFHGTSDIILKPLEGVLAGLTGFAGTALMGDGSVLMILNPKELT